MSILRRKIERIDKLLMEEKQKAMSLCVHESDYSHLLMHETIYNELLFLREYLLKNIKREKE